MKTIMYRNLNAEQARQGMTDTDVAKKINIDRATYAQKKRTGGFRIVEATALCELFNSPFEYLFEKGKEA